MDQMSQTPEFKENVNNAGYNLREIKSTISESNVRILWPDEQEDVEFLENYVQKRVENLDNGKHVTIAYDSESVCMQFGDIFDENIDYYNWDPANENVPKIKTNKSIIISFYKHKDYYSKEEPILINIMKPLLEHQRVTLLMFDFTNDIEKLNNYGINIKTSRVIDVQLAKLPENFVSNETSDFIRSTGWSSIGEFICQVKKEDNENAQLISKAKKCVQAMKQFPHEENSFILKHYKYPSICKFTKKFLDYSAGDIFFTAIIGVDILTCGEFEDVKERTQIKLNSYHEYRKENNSVGCFRQACYLREKIAHSLQQPFSKDSQTSQLFSIYNNLKSTVSLLDKHPELLQDAITWLNDETADRIRQRYEFIFDILTDEDNVHLTNIKKKACLAYVQGLQKTPELISPFNDDDDEKIKAEFNLNFGGGMKKKSESNVWTNISNSLTTTNGDGKTSSNAKNIHNESKSAYNDEDYFASNFNNKSASQLNSPWSNISMPKSPSSIDDSSKFSSTHPKNAKNAKYKSASQLNSPWSNISMPKSPSSIDDSSKFSSTHPKNAKNAKFKSASNQFKSPSNCVSMKNGKASQFNSNYPKLSNEIMNQHAYIQPTNKMVSFKPTQNRMTEITSNQKQQHETIKQPSKPTNNVWLSVTQLLESQSDNAKKTPSGIQANLPPPAKPPQNDDNNQKMKANTKTNPYSKLSKNTN